MDAASFEIVQQYDGTRHSTKITCSETPLGRGQVFEITDKRVSRKHAVLLLNEGQLTLKSTHVNPCFLNLKRHNKKMLLKLGETVRLYDGDQFSLLQEKYNFQVVVSHKNKPTENDCLEDCKIENQNSSTNGSTSHLISKPTNSTAKAVISCDETSLIKTTNGKNLINHSKTLTKVQCQSLESSVACFTDMSNSDEVGKRKRKLPEWMSKHTVKKQCNKQADSVPPKVVAMPSAKNECNGGMYLSPVIAESDNVESLQTNSILDQKKHDIKPNNLEISNLSQSDPEADNTHELNVTTTTSYIINKNKSVDSSQLNLNSRNKCAYGDSCYRKNPIHFQEYSHPGDTDYCQSSSSEDDENRPECEFGLNCYRKNPLHKKQFKHTRRIPPPRTASKPNQNDLDDVDDYESSFIDDDDDQEDETLSEDSDWQPSQQKDKRKQSQPSDDSSDEDIEELVSNAKQFVKNKRLWKK